MRQAHRLAALSFLLASMPAAGGDKQSVPPKADQDPVRAHVKVLFKAEYAKADRLASAALAAKLVERAAEEGAATRYVMLTEGLALAARAGEIDLAVRAARQIDQDFKDPDLTDSLAGALAEASGGRDRVADYRPVAAGELSAPATAADKRQLGQKWLDAVRPVRADTRLPALRRSRHWLCEALASTDLRGLARTETEKACQEVTAEVDRIDAKGGRFTLYEGKWVVKYDNNYTHEYVVKSDGSLAFDRCVSPDGTVSVKKEERTARLVRRAGVVLVPFAQGKLVERFSVDGDKLVVERFDPASLYPKSPNNKGEGAREK